MQGKQKDVLWALVSAHVAAPFLFRNYFPQDWLSFVNENHCKHIFYWKTDQQKEREIETGNIIWKHDMLDVAAFGLEKQKVDDERVWESLSSQVVELKTLSEWQGKHVVVQGWQVQGEVGSGQEKIAPCALNGVIRVQQGIRYFVETKPCNAHHGMCGGPILLPESNTCVGILEGLVPDSSQLEHITQMEWKEFFHSIAGYAAFLEASVLVDFIDQLEKQRMEESFPGL